MSASLFPTVLDGRPVRAAARTIDLSKVYG